MSETIKKETKILGILARGGNVFITSRRQALYEMINRRSVQEDMEAAQKGDDAAFFRLIEFKKTIIFEPWVKARVDLEYFFGVVRPSNGTGSRFFERLGNAIIDLRINNRNMS